MAHYDDVVMPSTVRFGSATAPIFRSSIKRGASGYRKVNRYWSQPLRELSLDFVKDVDAQYDLLRIFLAVAGPGHSFLCRDWNDWNTTDGSMRNSNGLAQITATDMPLQNTTTEGTQGDGSTTTFQMVKTYSEGATATLTRTIQKPQSGTVKVAVGGVAQTEGVDFTVDYSTGIVTFTTAPGAGSPVGTPDVTWGGAFYVPVVFQDDDTLSQALVADRVTSTSGIVLEEVRL